MLCSNYYVGNKTYLTFVLEVRKMDFVNVSMLKIRVIFFSCENINLEVENIEKREQDKMK